MEQPVSELVTVPSVALHSPERLPLKLSEVLENSPAIENLVPAVVEEPITPAASVTSAAARTRAGGTDDYPATHTLVIVLSLAATCLLNVN